MSSKKFMYVYVFDNFTKIRPVKSLCFYSDRDKLYNQFAINYLINTYTVKPEITQMPRKFWLPLFVQRLKYLRIEKIKKIHNDDIILSFGRSLSNIWQAVWEKICNRIGSILKITNCIIIIVINYSPTTTVYTNTHNNGVQRKRSAKERESSWLSCRWKTHKTKQEHPTKNNPTGYPT